jgi:hypothetical protein
MTASLCARNPDVCDLQFNNADYARLCELGVFLPAGVFVADVARDVTYFRDAFGSPYDGSLSVPADVARACGMCAAALRDAVAQGIARGRPWVTDRDRAMAEFDALGHLAEFLATCGGFHVS